MREVRLGLAIAVLCLLGAPSGAEESRAHREGRFYVRETTGVIPEGAPRIRVETDLGSVRVQGAPASEVRYRIRIRAAGEESMARRRVEGLAVKAIRKGDVILIQGQAGQHVTGPGLSAEFELTVPTGAPAVEVVTGAGNIEVTGVDGPTTLNTRGGTIAARDLGGPLQAKTQGGTIVVGSVRSHARLVTAGGNVRVDAARGDVVVQTSGGEVVIGRVEGEARVETGGGGVRIDAATGNVVVGTSGGNIVLGEIGGQVSAATAGGSIRVGSARGGVRCETAAGPILLQAIDGPVRAVTSAGNIQADFSGTGEQFADSDLQTWFGDVIVSLPESLPVTIRALIDNAVGQRIRSDFPLRISREAEAAGRPMEIGEGEIGGGGSILKIRTLGGNILIRKAKKSKI